MGFSGAVKRLTGLYGVFGGFRVDDLGFRRVFFCTGFLWGLRGSYRVEGCYCMGFL